MSAWRLSDLGNDIGRLVGEGTVEITGLASDSRAVRPGDLFAALSGSRADGSRYVGDALARGAVAVLGGPSLLEAPPAAPLLIADDPRRALALIAARFYGRQPRHIAAVTGTSGKTSTASFVRQLWTALGRKAASIGTLGIEAPGHEPDATLTTPEPIALHKALAELAAEGVEHLGIEASSHGLDQRRLDGLRIEAAAFTNLARDHYDYHGGPEAYLAAKRRLFDTLLDAGRCRRAQRGRARSSRPWPRPPGPAACGCSTMAGRPATCGSCVWPRPGAGRRSRSRRWAGGMRSRAGSWARSRPTTCWRRWALAVGCGEAVEDLLPHLGSPPGAARTGCSSPPTMRAVRPAFVDYSHKPEALEQALLSLRPHTAGRLLVVFGCGGDRDAGKRPLMGEIAVRNADLVYVTDDNPRSEDPASIRRAILAAAPGALEIGDREEAIRPAFAELGTGDALLVAGKGHETYQIVGDRTLPFDDAEVLRRCALESGGTPA